MNETKPSVAGKIVIFKKDFSCASVWDYKRNLTNT